MDRLRRAKQVPLIIIIKCPCESVQLGSPALPFRPVTRVASLRSSRPLGAGQHFSGTKFRPSRTA
jgi:hypothetical protein